MVDFATMRLPATPTEVAPDGSDVRVLLLGTAGGMAHFELGPGKTSKPFRHQTVEEIWYILGGRGQMWRQQDGRSEIVDLDAGTCISIPVGTHFQFRALGFEPLAAIGLTMPNWPGPEEAIPVDGCPDWTPTV
jgi:mannose-6-phosphate isomerase-like protein (cupin superfamily)